MDHQGLSYCGYSEWRSGRYDSKVNPVGPLDADKLAEAVLLYVFNIALPASLLQSDLPKRGWGHLGKGQGLLDTNYDF